MKNIKKLKNLKLSTVLFILFFVSFLSFIGGLIALHDPSALVNRILSGMSAGFLLMSGLRFYCERPPLLTYEDTAHHMQNEASSPTLEGGPQDGEALKLELAAATDNNSFNQDLELKLPAPTTDNVDNDATTTYCPTNNVSITSVKNTVPVDNNSTYQCDNH